MNIRSDKNNYNSLTNRLTNPNWYSNITVNVEAEYKDLQAKKQFPFLPPDIALSWDKNLMFILQLKKFNAHPELIDEINEQGGLSFLQNCNHIVGVKNSRWEGEGLKSNFIQVLCKSYEFFSKSINKFQK